MNEDKIRYAWEHGIENIRFLDLHNLMDENYVREFWDNILNYRKMFTSKHFSEDFLREVLTSKSRFKFRNWDLVVQTQPLSEQFVEEFAEKWNWDWVFLYQDVSREFIEKHKEKISEFVCEECEDFKEFKI